MTAVARDRWPLIVCTALILALTLFPTEARSTGGTSCWFCGLRPAADAAFNLALFVPFGAALGVIGTAPLRAAAWGSVLSGAIEIAQFWVPGRYATLTDLLLNTAGAALGATVVLTWRKRA